MLFELLTGAPPYRGDSAMNVAYQHVHSRVPAPSSRVRRRHIPTEIDEIVVAATDSDPAGRPADAGAFLAELADVRVALGAAGTASRAARPGNPVQRAPTDVRRRPAQARHRGHSTSARRRGHDTDDRSGAGAGMPPAAPPDDAARRPPIVIRRAASSAQQRTAKPPRVAAARRIGDAVVVLVVAAVW